MAKCEEELHRLELEAMETFADLCRLYLSDSLTNLEVLETLLKLTEEYPHLQDKGSMDEVFSKMFEILNLQPFLQVRRRKNLLRRSKSDFNELHITFSSRSTQSTRTRSLNNTRPFSILQSSAITDTPASDVNCSICLEKLCTESKTLSMLECYHEFHAHCLSQWVKKTPTCPICRRIAS